MRKIKAVISFCMMLCLFFTGCSNTEKSIDRVDYSDSIGAFEEMAVAPSESYIVACLKETPTVVDVVTVTSGDYSVENCIATVYFSSNLVDQSEVNGETVAEKGTDCGGSIDIFATCEEAKKRNEYLAGFDNTLLDSGLHTVVGSIVVRVSKKIDNEEQMQLAKDIISVVTSGDVDIQENKDESKLNTLVIEEETQNTETSKHEHNYIDASCIAPKTCSSCGETEGEALGHNWKDASCNSPKTCNVCGESEGDPLGHEWKDATCMTPKSCSICGETEGSANGHNYTSGYCDSCRSKDPDYVSETLVWIPTNGGKKYHTHSNCSNMDDPIQVTKSEAVSQGFDACKRCH